MKWEAFKEQVEGIRDHAQAYEDAYNRIKASVERQSGIKQILQELPLPTKVQVEKEKERLEEERRIAISEKGAYVRVRWCSVIIVVVADVVSCYNNCGCV